MKTEAARNWSHWFEIPVSDMTRAKVFYESIFGVDLNLQDFGSFKMAIFPHKEMGAALVWGQWYEPSTNGVLVYLNAQPDLSQVLDRVESAGGKVLQPKKQISETLGFMALFEDSEGNRLALHSAH
jgi:predicted enzyme related to lactoylglutathione lyase